MELSKFSLDNIRISPTAKIGKNVKIGNNTVIYDNVIIGDNTIICDNCVLGEPLSDYYSNMESYTNPQTIIGNNALIRSYTIIYAGNTIGDNFQTGHRACIRENNIFGTNCSIGTLCDIQGYSNFGNYCRLHSNVFVAMYSTLSNFVFVYPSVVIANDPTPPSNKCEGPIIGDYSQIAAASVILPRINIGKHCLIGAGSVVTTNVDDYMLAVGNPAKIIKDVRTIKNKYTNDFHYPWPYHFDRNMPWQEMGYEQWRVLNDETNG